VRDNRVAKVGVGKGVKENRVTEVGLDKGCLDKTLGKAYRKSKTFAIEFAMLWQRWGLANGSVRIEW